MWQHLIDKALIHPSLEPWLGTVLVVLGTLGLSRLADFHVRNNAKTVETARAWRRTFRYLLTLCFLASLGLVWAEQVKHLLFAAAALLASVLLVSKELVMCLLGDIVKFYGKLCPIGQVVEIDGVKGEVIDSGFLTTSLQVIEHSYSGRVVCFPNSVFLSQPVTRLSLTGEFRLVFVRIPVPATAPVEFLASHLMAIVTELVAPYQEEAESHLGRARETLLLDFPSIAPRILLEPLNFEEVTLAARFVCPTQQRSSLEQAILLRFYRVLVEVGAPTKASAGLARHNRLPPAAHVAAESTQPNDLPPNQASARQRQRQRHPQRGGLRKGRGR